MKDVVIVAATRTPVACFQGALGSVPAADLGANVISNLLARTGIDPKLVDEVILGQVLTSACGQNPARQAVIKGGLPIETVATSVNKVCGSGIKTVHLGAQAIMAGDAEVIIAGGQESMSQSPYLLPTARDGLRMGHGKLLDSLVHDGLWDAFNNYHMGITAENLAAKYGITREEQDAYALNSQLKAAAASAAGRFQAEMSPVTYSQRRGPTIVVDTDEQVRPNTTIEELAKLKAVFKADGSVTAGNSSPINDGAAGVMLMSAKKAKQLGLPVLAHIKACATAGVDPSIMGIGPAFAVRKCLKKAGWTLDDLDLIEANEAFAVQALSVSKELGWDMSKVNVNGGAIAIGHPIGASGTRILVTLLYEMMRRDAKKGLATLCIGGGMGIAMAVER